MKNVFFKLIAFVICLTLLDVALGILIKPILLDEPDAGNNHSNFKQSLYDKEADIVILGASKANHHYIPDSISKQLNLSVLNTGLDGDNVITSWIQFKSITQRHVPKIVIIDVSAGQTAGDYQSLLLSHKCYYGINNEYTNAVNELVDKSTSIKLYSNLYKLNEALPDILQSYLSGNKLTSGFIPLHGTNSTLVYQKKTTGESSARWGGQYQIEDAFRTALNEIVDYCKVNSIDAYMVYSPTLISYTDGVTNAYAQYCSDKSIKFLNYEDDSLFVNHPEYFKDYNHLNDKGAKVFTNDFINEIK